MKKIIHTIIVIFTLFICFSTFAKENNKNNKKDVFIFSKNGCPFCAKLEEDLNNKIIKDNPNINFIVLKISDNNNVNLLRKLLKKYNVSGDIGLPIMFIGNNYLMGWGNEELNNLLNKYLEEIDKE